MSHSLVLAISYGSPLLAAVLLSLSAWLAFGRRSGYATIQTVDVGIEQDQGAGFPLKIRPVMRNDSQICADVRVSKYIPHKVNVRSFPRRVLQVDHAGKWYPYPDGVENIAVLPGQSFTAWIGPDESFTVEQLQRLRGTIGTVVFIVNGRETSIAL